MAKKFIKAMKLKKGALTKAAKRAGKSIQAYCRPILAKGKATTAYRRCHLALRVLKKLPKPSKAARKRGARKAVATKRRKGIYPF